MSDQPWFGSVEELLLYDCRIANFVFSDFVGTGHLCNICVGVQRSKALYFDGQTANGFVSVAVPSQDHTSLCLFVDNGGCLAIPCQPLFLCYWHQRTSDG